MQYEAHRRHLLLTMTTARSTQLTSFYQTPASPRLDYIDGLRGLAMLMVLFYHCWLFNGVWHVNLTLGHHIVDLTSIFGLGHIGVNLFLLLSGFCLYWPFVNQSASGNLRREPTLREFAKKRMWRILPPYYVTLLLFGSLAAWQDHSFPHLYYLLHWLSWHSVMLHNLRPDYIVSINGSLWSLGLESQLYVLFPILVEAYRRFPPRLVLLSVLIFNVAYRFAVSHGGFALTDGTDYVLAYSIFGRCFEFALGMFIASIIAQYHREHRFSLRATDALLLLVFPFALLEMHRGHFQTWTDIMWGLVFAALLLDACRPHTYLHRVLSSPWLTQMGFFSYSVYLIHLPVILMLGSIVVQRHFSNFQTILFQFLAIPLILVLGYLFHLAFERPFLRSPQAKSKSPIIKLSQPPMMPSEIPQSSKASCMSGLVDRDD